MAKVKYKIKKHNTKVTNYNELSNEELMSLASEIWDERIKAGYETTRSIESYYREIKAHRRLFKMGLFRSHTKDTDLEEPIKWYMEFAYRIIGW